MRNKTFYYQNQPKEKVYMQSGNQIKQFKSVVEYPGQNKNFLIKPQQIPNDFSKPPSGNVSRSIGTSQIMSGLTSKQASESYIQTDEQDVFKDQLEKRDEQHTQEI